MFLPRTKPSGTWQTNAPWPPALIASQTKPPLFSGRSWKIRRTKKDGVMVAACHSLRDRPIVRFNYWRVNNGIAMIWREILGMMGRKNLSTSIVPQSLWVTVRNRKVRVSFISLNHGVRQRFFFFGFWVANGSQYSTHFSLPHGWFFGVVILSLIPWLCCGISCPAWFPWHQVEERLTFLSEGTTPRKNLEVMQEAIKEAWKAGETWPTKPKNTQKCKGFENENSDIPPTKSRWHSCWEDGTWCNLTVFCELVVPLLGWQYCTTCDSIRPKDVGLDLSSGDAVRTCAVYGRDFICQPFWFPRFFNMLQYSVYFISLRWLSGWHIMDSRFRDFHSSRLPFTLATNSTTDRWPSNARRRQRRLQPRRQPPQLVRPLRKELQNLQRKRSADLSAQGPKFDPICLIITVFKQHTFLGPKIANRRKVAAEKTCSATFSWEWIPTKTPKTFENVWKRLQPVHP